MNLNRERICFTVIPWLLLFCLQNLSLDAFGKVHTIANPADSIKPHHHENNNFDSTYMYDQFDQISSLLRDENNQEALKASKALSIYVYRYEMWEFYANSLMLQANACSGLLNFSQAEILVDSSLRFSIKHLGWEHRVTATAYNDLALLYISRGKYLIALDHMLKTVSIRKKVLKSDHPSIGRSLNNLASIYGYLGDIDKEIDLLKESVEIKKRALGEYSDAVAIGYNNLAVAYRSKGDYTKALEYIEKVIEIDQKILPSGHPILAQDYNAMSGICLSLNNQKKALKFLDRAFKINTAKFGIGHPNVAKNMLSYANIYEKQNNFDKQLYYLEKSLEIRKNAYGENHHLVAEIHQQLGVSYMKLGFDRKAMLSLYRALNIRTNVFNSNHHLIAQSHNKLAEFFISRKSYDSALFHSQGSLSILDSTYDFHNLKNLPSKVNVVSKGVFLETLKNRSECLMQLSNEIGDENFHLSLETNIAALNLINELRMDFDSKLSDKIFLDNSYSLFEKTMAQCIEVYKKTEESLWIEKAFQISEMSKSFRLSKVLNESKAKKFARIPDSLLIRERFLKKIIAKNSQSIISDNKSKTEISELKRNLFTQKRELDSLIGQMEVDFPKYHKLKYDNSQVSLNETQKSLGSKELFLEFFVSENTIYSFAITNDQFQVFSFPKSSLFTMVVKNFRKSISDFRFITDSVEYADDIYVRSASKLFEYLLKEPLEYFSMDIDRIVIVPDRELGLVSFDALLVKNPNIRGDINYRKLDYVMNHYNLSIAPSATILYQSKYSYKLLKTRLSLKLYAGFAPVYHKEYFEKDVLTKLSIDNLNISGAQSEVQKVSSIFGGSIYLDTLATESNFKGVSGNYRLLHLAMHGLVGENSTQVKLLFSKKSDNNNDGYLHIPEIYNLNLNADMIVLSACNTGYGQVQKGEGVISLSRAFMYSGSPSVVMSLWSLPDKAAPIIIGNLSKGLIAGHTKDIALNNAKFDYIRTVEDKFHAHPYFWAGVVAIGDMSAIDVSKKGNSITRISLISLLLLSIWYAVQMRRSN